jgi:hypothetical protein
MTDTSTTLYDRDDIVPAGDLPSPPAGGRAGDVYGEDVAVDPDTGPRASLRQTVREDLRKGFHWADGQVEATRERIRQEPTKALLYGVVGGLVLGLLLRR